MNKWLSHRTGVLALAVWLAGCASMPDASPPSSGPSSLEAWPLARAEQQNLSDEANVRLMGVPDPSAIGQATVNGEAGRGVPARFDGAPLQASCFANDEIVSIQPLSPGARVLSSSGRAAGLVPGLTVSAGSLVAIQLGMGSAPSVDSVTRTANIIERKALEAKVQEVLERDLGGREINWQVASTGERVTFRPGPPRSAFKEITVPRTEEVARTPASFRVETGTYRTVRSAVLRPTPAAAGKAEVDRIPANRGLTMMGRVRGLYGENWMLVGQNGIGYGYVDAADVTPFIGGVRPTPYERSENDRIGMIVRDPVSATVNCRDLTVSSALGSSTMTACRGADGRWVSDLPEGTNRNAACLATNRQFLIN